MTLSERDSRIIWHPYTQMQTAPPAIGIVRGEGAWLFDETGKKYLDAISSWWTNLHGHAHPYLASRIAWQAGQLEHLIFAGFTHEPAVALAEMLIEILPSQQKRVFYSDNGSTAVEVAIKMACQYWNNKGVKRTKFIALKEGYHGDTFGAMSVSGRSAFTHAFEPMLFGVHTVEAPLLGREETALQELKELIRNSGDEIAAFIYEPVIQGTAGMRLMNPDTLNEMIACCRREGILCIADEVMTGFGRTGKMFASEYMEHEPDLVCLSKGLTGGMMALGVTTSTEEIYKAFLSDDKMKTLFHGHSYTANPIACSAGIASLELFALEHTLEKIKAIASRHVSFVQEQKEHPSIKSIYSMGVILVIELKTKDGTGYFNSIRDKAYAYFLERGVLIRPLGNIIYLFPPYCIREAELNSIYQLICQFLDLIQ